LVLGQAVDRIRRFLFKPQGDKNSMDSNSSSQIRLSSVIRQFIEAKNAQCLSKNTLIDYSRTYKKLCSFLVDDRCFTEISVIDIRQFMNSQSHLSKKTRLNIHIGLSSLWKWAIDEELCTVNIMRKIHRPKPEKRAIIPFSRTEIERIFASLDPESLQYKRDRAILLVLLDTGMRASELCMLKNGGWSGMKMLVYGKGDKERVLPMSSITYQALSEYLRADDRENLGPKEYLFLTYRKKSFRNDDLYHMINKLGEEVGIKQGNRI
jgi:integrase/recombinase XerD